MRPPCCGNIPQTRSRIINGKYVELNKYPWMAYIRPANCGGSLINNRFVLTAAHCFHNPIYNYYEVSLGGGYANWYNRYVKVIPVEKVINHENFDKHYLFNDITLLKLSYRVEFDITIQPICLPYKTAGPFDFVNKNAVVAGWGTNENGHMSPSLKETTVQVWGHCKPYGSIFEDNHVCANNNYGSGTCYGDSGGPLFQQLPQTYNRKSYWIQIGIVSFGFDTICAKIGTGYSNVTTQMEWIENTMWKYQ